MHEDIFRDAYVEQVTNSMRTIHIEHAEKGRKTYYPTWNLIDMLLLTEIYPTKALIKLPAEVIYVGIPNNHPFKKAFGLDSRLKWKGIYLAQRQTPHPTECLFMTGLSTQDPSLTMSNECYILGNGNAHISITWNIGDTIKSVMDSINEERNKTKESRTDTESILRFITNLATYLTSSSCVQVMFKDENRYKRLVAKMKKTKNQQKVEKLKKKIEKETVRHGIILGSDIVLDRTHTQEYHPSKNTGRKIGVRHWVAGHWRNQAYGRNFQDRRLLWIKPHLRGPLDAPMQYSKHVVKVNKR